MEKNLKILEEGEALFASGDPLKGDTYSGLSWESYSKYCQSTKANKIETALRCSILDGDSIRWDGSVRSVEILRVSNYKRDLLSYVFPKVLRNMLTCIFGEPNAVNCPPHENCGHIQDYVEGRWKCHVNRWNVYTYLIRMRMDSGILKTATEVHLTAGHEFGNFTVHLQGGDRIWFEGSLKSRMWHNDEATVDPLPEVPSVVLGSVGCLSCQQADLKFESSATSGVQSSSILQVVRKSLKYLLNSIFNPILVFN